jgi:hypothetical protein
MAVPELKHNRDEKLNVENLQATPGNGSAPHRLFIDPTLFEWVPCPGTSSRTASITAAAGLGHHPSLVIKGI